MDLSQSRLGIADSEGRPILGIPVVNKQSRAVITDTSQNLHHVVDVSTVIYRAHKLHMPEVTWAIVHCAARTRIRTITCLASVLEREGTHSWILHSSVNRLAMSKAFQLCNSRLYLFIRPLQSDLLRHRAFTDVIRRPDTELYLLNSPQTTLRVREVQVGIRHLSLTVFFLDSIPEKTQTSLTIVPPKYQAAMTLPNKIRYTQIAD